MKRLIATIALAALLPACTGGWAGSNYQPVIDAQNSPGKNPASYPSELAACQALSSQRQQLPDVARGAGVGAAVGAAGGALTGAVRGSKIGAATGYGALAGVLVGAGTSAYQANQGRQDIVMTCMRNYGWSVLGR